MESLSRLSGTPSAWCADPDAYIQASKAELLAHLIEPRTVEATTIVTGEPRGIVNHPEPRSFTAIARRDDTWLLFEPITGRFFRAYGSKPDDRSLGVLEFGSRDALLEWVG